MKSKTKNITNNQIHAFLIILALVATALLAILYLQVKQLQLNDEAILKNQSMSALRQATELHGGLQPITDAASKRLYLPGLNLYLPLNLDTLDVNYRVTDANGGGTTDLVFSSEQNNSAVTPYKDPLSECLDLVRAEVGATVSQPINGETAQPPFNLADGRNVYTYLPKPNPNCNEYQLVSPSKIETAVRQLQSY